MTQRIGFIVAVALIAFSGAAMAAAAPSLRQALAQGFEVKSALEDRDGALLVVIQRKADVYFCQWNKPDEECHSLGG